VSGRHNGSVAGGVRGGFPAPALAALILPCRGRWRHVSGAGGGHNRDFYPTRLRAIERGLARVRHSRAEVGYIRLRLRGSTLPMQLGCFRVALSSMRKSGTPDLRREGSTPNSPNAMALILGGKGGVVHSGAGSALIRVPPLQLFPLEGERARRVARALGPAFLGLILGSACGRLGPSRDYVCPGRSL
jgi:hypothetical protein